MERSERIQVERHLYRAGLCLPVALLLFGVLFKHLPAQFHTPCVLHAVTGLYCPGCGGTRAAWLLVHGRIFLSFLYHPVVLYGTVVYLWFMISHTAEYCLGHRFGIGMHYRNLYLYLALALVVINTAVKDIALTAFGIDFIKMLDAAAAF